MFPPKHVHRKRLAPSLRKTRLFIEGPRSSFISPVLFSRTPPRRWTSAGNHPSFFNRKMSPRKYFPPLSPRRVFGFLGLRTPTLDTLDPSLRLESLNFAPAHQLQLLNRLFEWRVSITAPYLCTCCLAGLHQTIGKFGRR